MTQAACVRKQDGYQLGTYLGAHILRLQRRYIWRRGYTKKTHNFQVINQLCNDGICFACFPCLLSLPACFPCLLSLPGYKSVVQRWHMLCLLSLPAFPAFDVEGDQHGLNLRWQEYIERFQNFLLALNIKDDTRKRAMLLHFAGEGVYRIFKTLPDTGEPKDFEKAVEKLTGYFAPKQNKEYERYMFRQAQQDSAESLDAFHTRLRNLSLTCQFTEVDSEIITQIIQGCSSGALRRRILREPTMKLSDILDLGRAMESSNRQASEIESNTAESVNRLGKRAPYPKKIGHEKPFKSCYNCGGLYPHSDGKVCPAKGRKCHNCEKYDHFSKVCRGQRKSEYDESKVHHIASSKENTVNSSSDDEFVYTVTRHNQATVRRPKPEATISVGKSKISMLIDSGASVNIMDMGTFSKLSPAINLQRTSKKIHAYGNFHSLLVEGKFTAMIETKKRYATATFYVVQGSSGCLLSYDTASDLGLIILKVDAIKEQKSLSHEQSQGKVKSREFPQVVNDYQDVFKGIGKLRGVKVKITVDNTVPPVAQSARRVPFHIRKSLTKKLRELEEQQIIERVPENVSTPWVSPLVVFPKPQNPQELRICVDMRKVNTAVERVRHPSPTVEEIIEKLNGASVFSKLDLTSGYHQIELDEDSRHLTTFATHKGLFRYTRLNFGLSSSAEIFQREIQQCLEEIPGVLNISDDILIFGKDQESHDAALQNVLEMFRQKNLRANFSKCAFNKKNLDFFGYHFSHHGIAPSQQKIKAIHNAPQPENVQAVRSFLGMTNYLSRFIPNYATLTEPLRKLTKKDVKWTWTDDQQSSFLNIKEAIMSSHVMAYFDPCKDTEIIADASPVGLGALLCQKEKLRDGTEKISAIAYASKALTDVEQRYSQIENEALALVWACEKFHVYIYGKSFTLVTDHKPLEFLFNKPGSRSQARIERWTMRLQEYDFTVCYKPGSNNPADYLSRHPVQLAKSKSIAEEYVNFIASNAVPKAMTRDEVRDEINKDLTMQKLKECLHSGKWSILNQEKRNFKEITVSVICKHLNK